MGKAKNSSVNVITFVLMVAFGLLALVAGYATLVGGSFDLRSKAATEEILLKQWTFDAGASDWKAADWGRQSVGRGVYSLVVDTKTETRSQTKVCTGKEKLGNYTCRKRTVVTQLEPRLERGSVDTVLLYPVNRFKIKLSVMVGGRDPRTQKTKAIPVSFMVQYKLEGKTSFETPVPLTLIADGAMQDIAFEFPKDFLRRKITDIKLSFVDMKALANTVIAIDEIRLVGYRETRGTTIIGTVIKEPGNVAAGKGVEYILQGYYEGQAAKAPVRFALMQESDSPSCQQGKECSKPTRRALIAFDEFVGKEVIAVGTVSGSEGALGSKDDRRKFEERRLPILYVSSMKLKNELPCQPIPSGCQDPRGQITCKTALREGYRWCQPTPPPKPQAVEVGCAVSGCGGELCVSQQQAASAGNTTCVYKASYACYASATCEKQANGQCGWTMTRELSACLNSAGDSNTLESRSGFGGSTLPLPPAGCSYRQVQCVKAPCDPILVCPTP